MTGKGIIWLGWERHIRSKFHTSGTALFLPLESQAVLNNRSPKMQDAEADCIINTCVFQMWSTLSTGNWVAYLMHQSPSISWSRRKCKAPLGTWEYLVPTEWKSCFLPHWRYEKDATGQGCSLHYARPLCEAHLCRKCHILERKTNLSLKMPAVWLCSRLVFNILCRGKVYNCIIADGILIPKWIICSCEAYGSLRTNVFCIHIFVFSA